MVQPSSRPLGGVLLLPLLLLLVLAAQFVADVSAFVPRHAVGQHEGPRQRQPRPPSSTFTTTIPQPATVMASSSSSFLDIDVAPKSKGTLPSQYWTWKRVPGEQEYRIRYQQVGDSGPAVICIHGFGGNCDHWRKNLPVLGQTYRAYSIDLLGYGYSEKPDPGAEPNSLFNFETWAGQLLAFVEEVVKPEDGVYLACNSVGGVAGLQLCVDRPDMVKGILLLNISLRMLHVKKQPVLLRPFVKALQTTLRKTPLGAAFFAQVATPKGVRNVLEQAYHQKEAVTDELIEVILKPGLEPGALPVFLDFISYSGGPLPEDLLDQLSSATAAPSPPVFIGWGEKDPWEPIELGKAYGDYPVVREFVRLPGLGHCPQDEGPELVNKLTARMIDTLEAEGRGDKA